MVQFHLAFDCALIHLIQSIYASYICCDSYLSQIMFICSFQQYWNWTGMAGQPSTGPTSDLVSSKPEVTQNLVKDRNWK